MKSLYPHPHKSDLIDFFSLSFRRLQCQSYLQPTDLRRLASPEGFAKLDRLRLAKAVGASTSYRHVRPINAEPRPF